MTLAETSWTPAAVTALITSITALVGAVGAIVRGTHTDRRLTRHIASLSKPASTTTVKPLKTASIRPKTAKKRPKSPPAKK